MKAVADVLAGRDNPLLKGDKPGSPDWEFRSDVQGKAWLLHHRGALIAEVLELANGAFAASARGDLVSGPEGRMIEFPSAEGARYAVEQRLGFETREKPVFEWEGMRDIRGAFTYGAVVSAGDKRTVVSVHVWDPGKRYQPRLWDPDKSQAKGMPVWVSGSAQKSVEAAKREAERMYEESL